MRKRLPVGIEEFEDLRTQGFYFVDKTEFIVDLLDGWGKVNLFTRPRRFGKSLNMSMLKNFFEIGGDKKVFDGLNIAREKELCEVYMGQFPVISISLKNVEGQTYEAAGDALRSVIGKEALRFRFLLESDEIGDREKAMYEQIIQIAEGGNSIFSMSDEVLAESIQTLTLLLHQHYGRKAVLLIDEYDVPLDKAFGAGYYDEMILLIRSLLGRALKGNESLQFAVLTGCLRVAKESVFTGLNNFKVFSITDVRFDKYYGFTDCEVRKLLEYYGLKECYGIIKEWYDGYRFGNTEVYCPWDVINYCDAVLAGQMVEPEDYWSNTSGNSIVRRFIDKSTQKTREEIEDLIAGETIVKTIRQELTYGELDQSIENLWSVLFTTGYLTQRGRAGGKDYKLAIPNREIRELFISQIREWFTDVTRKDGKRLRDFCEAFARADARTIEKTFTAYLNKTISIRDTHARKPQKENFYHGILLGLLSSMEEWVIRSNAESGAGYSDILVEIYEEGIGIVIELKYARNGASLEAGCREALAQIEERGYEQRLRDDGMETIIKCAIACYQKRCKVETYCRNDRKIL